MLKKGLSYFLLSIGLLVHVPFCSSGDPCPPNEELKVCSCRHIEASPSGELPYTHRDILKDENGTALELDNPLFFTIIDCDKSSNTLELEEDITLGLHRKKIDKLTLREIPAARDHVLANLPMGFLRNTRVKFITIQDSKLSGDFIMDDFPFGGQEQSLIMLSINNCSLYGALTYDVPGTVNTKNLEYLLRLEVLDLTNNYLTVITSSAFEVTCKNISLLHLGLNSIKKIEPLAFRGLPNLKGISLRNNCLRSLDRGIFPDTMELLETIDLGQNYIHAVRSNLFTDMPALTSVSLSGNFLHSLPEQSWKQIWSQLKYIDLEANFINCNCELLWLTEQNASAASRKERAKSTNGNRRNATAASRKERAKSTNGNRRNATAARRKERAKSMNGNRRRIVIGKCIYHKLPNDMSLEYELSTLKRNQIMCLP